MDRRNFIVSSLAAGAAAAVGSEPAKAEEAKSVRILGVACSPRKGKTTAMAVQAALDGAKTVDPRITTQLLDLGGMNISGWVGGATPAEAKFPQDDFNLIEPMLNPPPDGLIIGSPSYFRSMSALCKAFLERLAVLRTPRLLLADKPVGALSVGAYRNGGQELVISEIHAAMLCHEVMVVGGKPQAHQGATLWNAYNDDITKDEFGIQSAKQLGIRVAEAAMKLSPK